MKDLRTTFLEACFAMPEDRGDGAVAGFKEERNERRMDGDIDWTGIVSERFIDPPTKGDLLRQGFKVIGRDEDLPRR